MGPSPPMPSGEPGPPQAMKTTPLTTKANPSDRIRSPVGLERAEVGCDACHRLQSVFTRRVVFVLGKGGVGKTTMAVAMALAAKKMGKRVLLAEISDAAAGGGLCGLPPLTDVPLQIDHHLWGACVLPKAELAAYIQAHAGPRFVSRKIIQSRLFSYLIQGAPGLKEVMSLGRIWRWEQERTPDGEYRFDCIFVDSPATGHALSLLRLPDQLIRMIRVGPLANQIREIQRLLKNRRKTCLVLVAIPEELPVNEAVLLYRSAAEELEMPVAVTLMNGVYPSLFTPDEATRLEQLKTEAQETANDAALAVVMSAQRLSAVRQCQQVHIDRMYAIAGGHVMEMPFYFTNDLTLADIAALSGRLSLEAGV